MGNDRFPKLLLHRPSYTHGHRSGGRPKNKWVNNIREDCENINMNYVYTSSISSYLGPDNMEKQCSQRGLPEREDNVIVATAI